MNFKFVLTALLCSIILFSCEKAQHEITEIDETNETPSIETFAKALSSAVSQHIELRTFIKNEAAKQFDKDYDVFYPYVKNTIVGDNKSFREYMLEYLSEEDLTKIEEEHPLLNVSVPDWEWFGAFSINTWDISDDDIVVGYADYSGSHPLFQNGGLTDILEVGMFPENPILIVKDNERMTLVSKGTKAGNNLYDFADDAFKPDTKVSVITDYYYLDTNPGSEWYDADKFKVEYPDIVAAWEEYGKDPYQIQRNLIYYNMRKGDNAGTLNPKVSESIKAIKLNKKEVMNDGDDSRLRDHEYKKAISKTDTTALIDAVWNTGKLEFKIVASIVKTDGTLQKLAEKGISVHAKELFNISKIQRNFYHGSMFSKRKYIYIGRYADLTPKWHYLKDPLFLNHWSPESTSSIIDVHIYEIDGTEEETVKTTVKGQQGIGIGAKINGLFELSFNSNATTYETVHTYTIKRGSDDLYSTEVYYHDYIIKDYAEGKYCLKTYSTGQFEFILLPTID